MKDDHDDDHKELAINLRRPSRNRAYTELTYQLPYPVNGSVRSLAPSEPRQ